MLNRFFSIVSILLAKAWVSSLQLLIFIKSWYASRYSFDNVIASVFCFCFENLLFRCFRYSDVRYLDPHCCRYSFPIKSRSEYQTTKIQTHLITGGQRQLDFKWNLFGKPRPLSIENQKVVKI